MVSAAIAAAIHPHATIRSAIVSSITPAPALSRSKLTHYGMRARGPQRRRPRARKRRRRAAR